MGAPTPTDATRPGNPDRPPAQTPTATRPEPDLPLPHQRVPPRIQHGPPAAVLHDTSGRAVVVSTQLTRHSDGDDKTNQHNDQASSAVRNLNDGQQPPRRHPERRSTGGLGDHGWLLLGRLIPRSGDLGDSHGVSSSTWASGAVAAPARDTGQAPRSAPGVASWAAGPVWDALGPAPTGWTGRGLRPRPTGVDQPARRTGLTRGVAAGWFTRAGQGAAPSPRAAGRR